MKIGRNFANLLYANYLDGGKKRLLSKRIFADVGVEVEIKAKADVVGQIAAARTLGIDHVELDGTVPNPYLRFNKDQKREVMEISISNDVGLSLLLPSAFIASGLCSPDEYSRRLAIKLQKRYIEFASDIGCKYCVVHPGWVPFYHASGKNLEKVHSNLIKSLTELGKFAFDKGIILHLKNNPAPSLVFTEVSEVVNIVRKVREGGVDLAFCFDIGHWLSHVDANGSIPSQPESVIEQIPAKLIEELHLSDYVPGEGIFCPPLHEQLGLIKRENLRRYMGLVKKKKAKLIVVSTALRPEERINRGNKILREETRYLHSFL